MILIFPKTEISSRLYKLSVNEDVYAAQNATAARVFCHISPLTAHGHCPVRKEPA